MKLTKAEFGRIIREVVGAEKRQVAPKGCKARVGNAIEEIKPELRNMSKAELELLSRQIDNLIAQLSERKKGKKT